MSNWYSPYHEALLERFLGLALIFGVLWPALWLPLATAWRRTKRRVQRIGQNTQLRQRHLS
jgi:hypothetical protein